MARYRVGPHLTVVSAGWPTWWHSHAEERLDQPVKGEPDTVVRFGANHRALQTMPRHENTMCIERVGEGWRLEVADVMRARWSPKDRQVEVEETSVHLGANFTLNNILRGMTSLLLPSHHAGLMLHATSGILDERGLLFAGLSGAGKSTLGLGFREVTYLSDDISLAIGFDAQPTLLSSPFFGSSGHVGAKGRAVPLLALCILSQGEKTTIAPIPPARVVPEVIRHVVHFAKDRDSNANVLNTLVQLSCSTPVLSVQRSMKDDSDTVFRRVLDYCDALGDV